MELHGRQRSSSEGLDVEAPVRLEERLSGHIPTQSERPARLRGMLSGSLGSLPLGLEGRSALGAAAEIRHSMAAAAVQAAAAVRRRTQRFVAVLLATILSLGGAVLPATALIVGPGTLGGFEIDGNLVEDALVAGGIDWANAGGVTVVRDDTIDSAFQGSSKELEPEGWVCQAKAGGVTPGKDNLLRAYVNPRISGTQAYVDLGFVKEVGEGDTHVNFEFNRSGVVEPFAEGPCPITRAVGDLLFTYDFGGTNDPVSTVRIWSWTGSTWRELSVPSTAVAATNNDGPVVDPLDGGTSIPTRSFGEMTIDLLQIPGFAPSCPGFAFVNVRSRSSGESFTSALQDKLPTTGVNLSTCGSVKLKKVDDKGAALAGATFGLYSGTTVVATCTTDALGVCDFPTVSPGTYTVREIAAPAGYAPSTEVRTVTVGFREAVDLTASPFTNPLVVGSLRIVKINDADRRPVAGIRFDLLQGGTLAKTRTGADASCTTGTDGTCTIADLVPGTYVLREVASTVPATMTAVADRNVTITGDQTLTVNITDPVKPIGISLTKLVNGRESVTIHAGDLVTYTLAARNSGQVPIDVTSLTDNNGAPVVLPAACAAAVAATTYIAVGATQALCTYTANPQRDVVNTADVVGTDEFGRTATARDTASVDVIRPAITLVKTVNGVESLTTSPGTPLAYRIVVTNTGDTPLTVESFSDVATPGGRVDLGSCLAAGTTLAVGASVTCTSASTAPEGGVTNTAEVVAVDRLGGDKGTVRADDFTVVTVLTPGLSITKLVNGEDDEVTVHAGDTLTYVITVRNSGNAPIRLTTFGDVVGTAAATVPGNCATLLSDDLLPVGGSRSCTYQLAAGSTDRLNTATVTAVEPVLGTNLRASDPALARVISPAIVIDKSVTPTVAHAGDPVRYTLTITNTGNTGLTLTGLTDKLGDAATLDILARCGFSTETELAPARSLTCAYDGVALADDTRNVATVTAVDVLGGPKGTVTDDDDAVVDVIRPKITLTKDVSAETVHAGDTVTYTIRFRNDGDTALTLSSLVDSVNGGPAQNILGTCGFDTRTTLQPTQSLTCTYDVKAGTADLHNVATVRAVDVLGGTKGTVTSTDDADVDVINPTITIDKTASPTQVHEGDLVTYTLVVRNTGDTDLTVTGLTDVANGQSIVLSPECRALIGTVLTAAVPFTCTYVVPAGAADIHNLATVVAVDRLGRTVTDDDDADVDVIIPSISVTKDVDKALAHAGDTVTYTVTVTNTGDTSLRLTALTDAVNGGTAADILARCGLSVETVLAAGASTAPCTYTAVLGTSDVVNVVNVRAVDLLGKRVQDSDDAVVDVLNPLILIDKTVDKPLVHAGDTVTYTLRVTNTGDTPLTVTSLDDAVNQAPAASLTACGIIGAVLAAGASATCTYTSVVGTADVVNVATVVGEDLLRKKVTDDDDAVVDVLNPAITIVKTGSVESISGTSGPVTFRYLVTNTGDAVLHDVVVTDDILGTIGTVARLVPGQSVTLTKDAVVGSDRPVNVGTVRGTDDLGKTVEANDDERITFVESEVLVRPLPPAVVATPAAPAPAPAPSSTPVARTGVEAGRQLQVALVLLVLGGLALIPERIRTRRTV